MVRTNDAQAGVLSLRTAVRLKGDLVVAGDFAEVLVEIGEQSHVAFPLVRGSERMNAIEMRPRARLGKRRECEL